MISINFLEKRKLLTPDEQRLSDGWDLGTDSQNDDMLITMVTAGATSNIGTIGSCSMLHQRLFDELY